VNGHVNGGAKPKLTLADLGFAQPTAPKFTRRKLTTQDAR
jgi:hypothetical protein